MSKHKYTPSVFVSWKGKDTNIKAFLKVINAFDSLNPKLVLALSKRFNVSFDLMRLLISTYRLEGSQNAN